MNNLYQIPEVSFTKEDYNKDKNEVFINLNNHRWLDELIQEYQKTHRRLIPFMNLLSPSGTVRSLAFPKMDKWEIIFESKKDLKVRLGYI